MYAIAAKVVGLILMFLFPFLFSLLILMPTFCWSFFRGTQNVCTNYADVEALTHMWQRHGSCEGIFDARHFLGLMQPRSSHTGRAEDGRPWSCLQAAPLAGSGSSRRLRPACAGHSSPESGCSWSRCCSRCPAATSTALGWPLVPQPSSILVSPPRVRRSVPPVRNLSCGQCAGGCPGRPCIRTRAFSLILLES